MSMSLVRAGNVLGAVLFFVAAQARGQAIPLDPRYGAGVELQNLGDYLYEGQTSAGGSVATGAGGAVISEGGAGFSSSPASHVHVTSVPGRGVSARAYLFDTLTFDVADGGSAQVLVRMAGSWEGVLASQVDYFFAVDTTYYTGRASPTGLSESNVDGAPAPTAFTYGSGSYDTGVIGSYQVSAILDVADGGVYSIHAQVRAQAGDGASAYMDDPLTIELPAGVTFTSASNTSYAVPEPSSWLLIGGGFIALARQRSPRAR